MVQRERKRVQRLRKALNMKKKQKLDKKMALDELRTMLPENTVKYAEARIELQRKAKNGRRDTTQMKHMH